MSVLIMMKYIVVWDCNFLLSDIVTAMTLQCRHQENRELQLLQIVHPTLGADSLHYSRGLSLAAARKHALIICMHLLSVVSMRLLMVL